MGTRAMKMFTWAGEEGDFDAFAFQTWEKMNPGPGEYSWGWFDAWLDDQKSRGRTTGFSIATALSDLAGWNGRFYDATPKWFYSSTGVMMNDRKVGKVVSWTDTEADPPVTYYGALPLYSDAKWREALMTFTLAFGARYNNDDRLDVVALGPGMDMETTLTKSPFPDGNMGYGFGILCAEYPKWYKQAFPTKPLFYACLPGQGRMKLTMLCKELGIGVKHNGAFLPDLDSWDGWGMAGGKLVNYSPDTEGYSGLSWGLWDHIEYCNANNVPVWLEDAHWMGKEEWYNGRFGALSYHPVLIDLHSGFFDETVYPKEQLEFIEAHTNVTMQTTPDVWCVLRDQEYDLQTWSQKNSQGVYEKVGCSGHVGNWEFGLEMDGDAPRVENIDNTIYGRQCRRVNEAAFYIDEGYSFPPYEIEVTWKQEGMPLTVEHYDLDDALVTNTFSSTGSGEWSVTKVVIEDRSFALTGGAAVHMVKATHVEIEPPKLDVAAIWGAVHQAEGMVAEANQALHQAYMEMNLANERALEAESRLADADAAVKLCRTNVDNAKVKVSEAQESVNAACAELTNIRTELEKVE